MTTRFDNITKATLPIADRRALALLEDSAGTIGRLQARGVGRKEARKSLKALTVARAQTIERVAAAELATTEASVVGAIMAQGQQSIATLIEEVTADTGVHQTRMTTLGNAERISHVAKRLESYQAINARVEQNAISVDEAEALKSQSDAALVRDVETTNARIEKSKEVVEELHGNFIAAVKRSTEHLR
jgi:hypothetical protein